MKENNSTSSLSEHEKRRLREKILMSVRRNKTKRKYALTFLATAASFTLLVALTYFNQFQSEPSLEEFVRSTPEMDYRTTEGVTLILGDDSQHHSIRENSSILYSSTGKNVHINSGKKLVQQTEVKDDGNFNKVIVPFGKRTMLQLSDGTKVWLNSGTTLIYPAMFSGKTRPVYLEGEAIFDVAHNETKPFRVISEYQEIQVTGTVFNVSHYPDDELMETVLKSGSVNITYKESNNKKVRLTPGSLSSFNAETAEIKNESVNAEDFFSWRDGFFTLDNTSMSEIMAKLSRYYNVEFIITSENLAAQKFSGKLELKENVQEVINVIRETTEFEYEIQKNKIIIK